MSGSSNERGANKRRFDWREDLARARDLTAREIDAYGYMLGWLEDWRQKRDLVAGRDAARRWWKEVALQKARPDWQLRQWEEAIRWFLVSGVAFGYAGTSSGSVAAFRHKAS